MDSNITGVFLAGKEVSILKSKATDFWMMYAVRGEAKIEVGSNAQPISSGKIAIIGKTNDTIRITASDDYESYVLRINEALSSKMVARYLRLITATNNKFAVISVGEQQNSILTIFQDITKEIGTEGQSNKAILDLRLQEIMVRLCQATNDLRPGISENKLRIVVAIQELLDKEYYRDFDLVKIASSHNISTSYLSHIFKQVTGVPVMRYLLGCRIAATKEYLQEVSLPINEIAERCGFNDYSNFSRTFKKETGYAPREYRNLYLRAQKQK